MGWRPERSLVVAVAEKKKRHQVHKKQHRHHSPTPRLPKPVAHRVARASNKSAYVLTRGRDSMLSCELHIARRKLEHAVP
mmetsp:Transcript_33460/g.65186  ORF Transcript_33460/g.65186 Transcript_33460/m.65186 type:complete len:80 (+) Transcript_33460:261-500(+)